MRPLSFVAQKTFRLIIFGETGAGYDFSKISSLLKAQMAGLLAISAGDLNDSVVESGALYNKESFISKNFAQLTFNLSQPLIKSRQEKISDLKSRLHRGDVQITDSDGTRFSIPKQDLLGAIDDRNYMVQFEYGTARFYAGDQLYETSASSLTLVCPSSQVSYSSDPKFVTDYSVAPNRSVSAKIVYSKPCPAPIFYSFAFALVALNDFDSVTQGNPAGASDAIQKRFNEILNRGAYATRTTLTPLTLNGTYQASNFVMLKAVQVKFDMRCVVEPNVSPLAPLLSKLPWPLISVGSTTLFIPAQKYDQSGVVTLAKPLISEQLSFQMVAYAQVPLGGSKALTEGVTGQLSAILHLPLSCFRKPLIRRDFNTEFLINITSVCTGDGLFEISQANATFWRLLLANELTLRAPDGRDYLAQPLSKRRIVTSFFVLSWANLKQVGFSNLLQHLPVRNVFHHRKCEFYHVGTDVAMPVWIIDAAVYVSSCAELEAIGRLQKETLGFVQGGKKIQLLDQELDMGYLRRCSEFDQSTILYFNIRASIEPILNRPGERVVFALRCQFDEGQSAGLFDNLQKVVQIDSDLGALFANNRLEDRSTIALGNCTTKFLLQIDWYALTLFNVVPGPYQAAAGGFSGVANATEFASTIITQYLQYYDIAPNRLLPGTNVSRVSEAGFYNGQWSRALLTDVIQISFAVATITGLQGADRPTHGATTFTYNNQQFFAPLQLANGSGVHPRRVRTIEILIACPLSQLPFNNISKFVDDFKEKLTQWTSIQPDFFTGHEIGPWTVQIRSTGFRINVTDQFMGRTIDLDAIYGDFTKTLATNKMAIKDEYSYPIHILPLKPNNFIIVNRYDETYLKMVPGICASVVLVLTVAYIDLKIRIGSWLKKRAASRIAVSSPSQAE